MLQTKVHNPQIGQNTITFPTNIMRCSSSLAAILLAGLNIRSSFALPLDSVDSLDKSLLKRAGPIVKYQALGDSYSAGVQAGNSVNSGGGGNNCMRTDGSYAYQLMNDPDVVNQGDSGYGTYIQEFSLPCLYLAWGLKFFSGKPFFKLFTFIQ